MAPNDARQKLNRMRREKGKSKNTPANLRDLRQLISKKNNKKQKNERVATGRVTKSSQDNPRGRDLRETNKKLAARSTKNTQRSSRDTRNVDSHNSSRQSGPTTRSARAELTRTARSEPRLERRPGTQHYVPPQSMRSMYADALYEQSHPRINDRLSGVQGASILISNLIPSITQSEIIELFGDIGIMTSVNMINQTTALVTYQSSSDAVKAVKVYHNRLLDGKPMYVNMMPNSAPR